MVAVMLTWPSLESTGIGFRRRATARTGWECSEVRGELNVGLRWQGGQQGLPRWLQRCT
jgi:hypothetical protein